MAFNFTEIYNMRIAQKKIKQIKLAQRIGINQSTLSLMLNNHIEIPEEVHIKLISELGLVPILNNIADNTERHERKAL